MSPQHSLKEINPAGFFLLAGLMVSLVSFGFTQIPFALNDEPGKEMENINLKLQQAVDEAWEVYHDAALSGTLSSPEGQVSIEEGLRQSRMLLIAARDLAAGESEEMEALEKEILNLTRKIAETSRSGDGRQDRSDSGLLKELREPRQFERFGEKLKTKISRLNDPAPMVSVPEGPFWMGSPEGIGRPDERIQRTVYIKAFQIDQFEVTNRQYLTFVRETGRRPPPSPYQEGPLQHREGIEDLPVVKVTWMDAFDYCHWAGKRLPTEAEWEKAARGTDGRLFPWGDSPPDSGKANFGRDWQGEKTLTPVGSHPGGRSFFGAMDMGGNVREWVQDWYDPEYFLQAPTNDPPGPEKGISKVIRGGSWHHGENSLRAAARDRGGFALKTQGIGFRCARSMEGQ